MTSVFALIFPLIVGLVIIGLMTSWLFSETEMPKTREIVYNKNCSGDEKSFFTMHSGKEGVFGEVVCVEKKLIPQEDGSFIEKTNSHTEYLLVHYLGNENQTNDEIMKRIMTFKLF